MSAKILVVDDEQLIAKTIERALSGRGYEVRVAFDADGMIKNLLEQSADLIILDINLGSVNSSTLIQKIRTISPESKILLISGANPEFKNDNFLEKPFLISDLRDKVKHILESIGKGEGS